MWSENRKDSLKPVDYVPTIIVPGIVLVLPVVRCTVVKKFGGVGCRLILNAYVTRMCSLDGTKHKSPHLTDDDSKICSSSVTLVSLANRNNVSCTVEET